MCLGCFYPFPYLLYFLIYCTSTEITVIQVYDEDYSGAVDEELSIAERDITTFRLAKLF